MARRYLRSRRTRLPLVVGLCVGLPMVLQGQAGPPTADTTVAGTGTGNTAPRGAAPETAATCSLHEQVPGGAPGASGLVRAHRVLAELRPAVRFTNADLPPMGLDDRMARYRVPGLAVTVIDGGRPAWTCVAGVKRAGGDDPVTRESLFQVKSVAKPVSAVAALRLVESGALVLDEPLSTRLRSYRIPRNEHTRATAPTLRHLLSHAAGFTRWGVDSYRPGEALPTLEESLAGRPPADVEPLDIDFTPGTRSRYSGGGYGVLQALLQDVTSRPFPDVVDSLVFAPLDMSHSLFPQPLPEPLEPFSADGHDSDGAVLPGGHETLPIMAAGGLWATAPDLARFLVAVSDAWNGEAGAVLGRDLAREMLTPQPGGRGLGFEVEEAGGSLLFHHGGSGDGFKAFVVGLPEEGAGAVILVNGDGGGELRYELLRAIAAEYDWPAYRETATYEVATEVAEEDLRRLEATYVWNSGLPSQVALRNGALHARFDEGEWVRLFPLSPTEFVSLGNVRYRFLPGAEGEYTLETTDETGTYTAVPPTLIEGWRVVTPGGPAALDSIHFRAMGSGVHTTAGAPALYFHPDSVGRAPYEVGATFMQIGEPGSDEGLGLMVAGVVTESGSARHLLFRVRSDGAYAIELREGGESTRTLRPWTRHEAIEPMSGEGGHSHNALRVAVATDQLVFQVNETVVATVPSEGLGAVEGVAGFFVGRDHDVHVDGFGITGPASASPPPAHDGTPSRELRFEHGGVELAGELRLPATANGPYPAIAFVHGSGESDRNHYWASRIGDVLTANGFAFLLPDKRGSGASGGDWRTADFHDLAGDALAAIERLRRLPEIDASRVGVLGFSQGGRIVSIVATRSSELRFVVNVSGSAVPFTEQLDHEMRNTLRQAGLDVEEVEEAMALHRTAERWLRGEVPWSVYEARLEDGLAGSWAGEAREFPRDRDDWRWDFFRGVIDFDPIPCWRRVEAPILVVYGADDEEDNVPVGRSVRRLEAALADVGHTDHTIRVLEGTGHGLWEPGTHPPRHREDFFGLLLDWIRDRIR